MKTIVQTLFVAACIFFSACGDDSGNNAESSGEGSAQVQGGTMTDPRDGRVYKTVTIGLQTWMTENLKYDAVGNCRLQRRCLCKESDESGCIGWGNDQSDRCRYYGPEWDGWGECDAEDPICLQYGGASIARLRNDCAGDPSDCLEYEDEVDASVSYSLNTFINMDCVEEGKTYGVDYSLSGRKPKDFCPEGWSYPSWEDWEALLKSIGASIDPQRNISAFIGTTDPLNFLADYELFGEISYGGIGFTVAKLGEFYFTIESWIRGRNFTRCVQVAPCDLTNLGEKKAGYVCSENGWVEDITGLVDERDGQSYGVVRIGNQVWMAQNLNYATEGSRCYADDLSNCELYGRFYNWTEASTACPSGWHLPSKEEWETLASATGVDYYQTAPLRSTMGWEGDANGTDTFGFSALPAGLMWDYGSEQSGFAAGFWADSSITYEVPIHGIGGCAFVLKPAYDPERDNWPLNCAGFAVNVRCIKDSE